MGKYSLSPHSFRSGRTCETSPPPPLAERRPEWGLGSLVDRTSNPCTTLQFCTHSFLIRFGIAGTHTVSISITHFWKLRMTICKLHIKVEVLEKNYKFSFLVQSQWRKPTPPPGLGDRYAGLTPSPARRCSLFRVDPYSGLHSTNHRLIMTGSPEQHFCPQVLGQAACIFVPQPLHTLRPAGSDPRVGDGLVWNPLPMAFKYTFLYRMQRS